MVSTSIDREIEANICYKRLCLYFLITKISSKLIALY